ncbi:hypothetical protein [Streptosporangium fragile]|uniref:hypothetical protein n=1 Tax=Streptosporangium fragile TaxID=46186 RepID=UPI0031EC945E
MTSPDGIPVVGASAAGLSTAEALRRLGHQGRLTLPDAGPLPAACSGAAPWSSPPA